MADMTPDQIAEINQYAEAFRQEFEEKTQATKTPKETKDNINAELDEVVPDAVAGLKWFIKHSKNESLKYRAITWLLDKKLDADKAENDPLTKFLQEMQKAVPEKAVEASDASSS